MTPPLAELLAGALAEYESRLRALPASLAESRPGGGDGWTRTQELGHLIDSAVNNRVRFVTATLAGEHAGPTYDGEGWVELAGYRETHWVVVIDLWSLMNRSLVRLIGRIPEARLSAPCRVGDHETVTLRFLIEDYVAHMRTHLDHILAV